MNSEKIEQLLQKYLEGETSLEEERQLRTFFSTDEYPEHLRGYAEQFRYYEELKAAGASEEFDPFSKIKFEETSSIKSPFGGGPDSGSAEFRGMSGHGNPLNTKLTWTLRIAAGLILLLTGFSAGLLLNQPGGQVSGQQVAALQQEISQMKAALMYGTDSYRQTSASERISAVQLSARVPDDSKKLDSEITGILIYTMNNDANTNVRQAAAEALFRFKNEPRVRKALIHSLSKQSDPLMQINLINMLVELKEKAAINEMQKLLMDADTRKVVKTRLEQGIAELKA